MRWYERWSWMFYICCFIQLFHTIWSSMFVSFSNPTNLSWVKLPHPSPLHRVQQTTTTVKRPLERKARRCPGDAGDAVISRPPRNPMMHRTLLGIVKIIQLLSTLGSSSGKVVETTPWYTNIAYNARQTIGGEKCRCGCVKYQIYFQKKCRFDFQQILG